MDGKSIAACVAGVVALAGFALFWDNKGSADVRVCEVTPSLVRNAKYRVKTSRGIYIINKQSAGGLDPEALKRALPVGSTVKITYYSNSYSRVVIRDVEPLADDPAQKCP